MVSIFCRSVALVVVEHPELAGLLGRLDDRLRQLDRTLSPVDEVGAHRGPRTRPSAAISRIASCSREIPANGVDGDDRGDAVAAHDLRCVSRLAAPRWTSSGFSSSIPRGSGRPAVTLCRPECSFSARTVATTTAASGTRPDVRHLMLKNRSAPMSEPNPASVTRYSPAWIPIRSATTDELPWAMLPKGPACTSTGVFSSVCSRLGLMASRMITVMAPAALSSSAVTGSPPARVADDDPPQARPQVLQRRGEREHGHDLGRRGDVEAGLARRAVLLRAEPDTMLRSDRSLTSSTRLQVTPWGSSPSALPVVEMVVDHGGQEVVRRGHRVEVPGQMQVEVLERDDLAVAAAGRATLDTEGRPHGGLTDGDRRLLAQAGERLPEPDGRRGLPLPERRRGDRGDDDVAGRGAVRQGSTASRLILATLAP